VIKGAVEEKEMERALRGINSQMGEGMKAEEAEPFANGICFPSLMSSPLITRLFSHSHAASVARSLLGSFHSVQAGQIAFFSFYLHLPHTLSISLSISHNLSES